MTQQEYDALVVKIPKYKKLQTIFWILFAVFTAGYMVISFIVGYKAGYKLGSSGGSLTKIFDYIMDVYEEFPVYNILEIIFVILSSACLVPAIIFTVLRATTSKKLRNAGTSSY